MCLRDTYISTVEEIKLYYTVSPVVMQLDPFTLNVKLLQINLKTLTSNVSCRVHDINLLPGILKTSDRGVIAAE